MSHGSPAIDLISVNLCVSCFGCQAACPQRAVRMEPSPEGFYVPVVDRTTCTSCGLCTEFCPVLRLADLRVTSTALTEPLVYAAWSTDETVRLDSSSGGVFSELARTVLEDGGVVFGCAWGPDWQPEHKAVHSVAELPALRGSKYVQSNVGNSYSELIKLASSGVPVLFSGLPCQVAAAKLALNACPSNSVVLVDLVCFGIMPPILLSRYLATLFSGDGIRRVSFRSKPKWSDSMAVYESLSGDYRTWRLSKDLFWNCFNYSKPQVCYDCPFATLPRQGDLTIGDFWGVPEELHDERGVSVVLANTESGRVLIEAVTNSGRLSTYAANLSDAAKKNPRLISGHQYMPPARTHILRAIAEGANFLDASRLCQPSGWQRFRSALGRVLRTAGLRK